MANALPKSRTKRELKSLISDEIKNKVFWEETNVSADESIMDHLILPSNFTAERISSIAYLNPGPQGKLIAGGSIFTLASPHTTAQWQLENRITKPKKVARTIGGAVDSTLRSARKTGEYSDGEDVDAVYFPSGIGVFESGSESSYNDQEYQEKNTNNKRARPGLIPEAKWARLFNTIQDYMYKTYKEAHATPSPASSFNPTERRDDSLPKREWSAQFANSPVPNDITAQKPDTVLVDYDLLIHSKHPKYRDTFKLTWTHFLACIELTESELTPTSNVPISKGLITKGYLMMLYQPWRRFVVVFSIAKGLLRTHYFDHSGLIISHPVHITNEPERLVDTLNTMAFSNLETLGFDPTIHMCNPTCMNTHQDLQVGAIGWVEDDQAQHLSIMSVLASSQSIFSRGTVCYRVQNGQGVEYALKDCWVDAEKKRHEVEVLQMVAGIPNVVSLVAEWDVNFEGESDCTELIRAHHNGVTSAEFCNRFHRRLLLTPCGEPLTSYTFKHELLRAFRDFVTAHRAMFDRHVFYGNLSPDNFILHEGKGFFIDLDHAAITQGNSCIRTRSTGTKPYMSMHFLTAAQREELAVTHTASDDLESLFYIFVEFATTFDGTRGYMIKPKTPIWVEAYGIAGNRSSEVKAGLVLSPANN